MLSINISPVKFLNEVHPFIISPSKLQYTALCMCYQELYISSQYTPQCVITYSERVGWRDSAITRVNNNTSLLLLTLGNNDGLVYDSLNLIL